MPLPEPQFPHLYLRGNQPWLIQDFNNEREIFFVGGQYWGLNSGPTP
jgi:hypothetical protein